MSSNPGVTGQLLGSHLNDVQNTHRRQKLTPLHLFTDLICREIFLTLQNKCKVGYST